VEITLFINNAFDGAQATLASMVSYGLQKQLGLSASIDCGVAATGYGAATDGITVRGLIADTITCGTIIDKIDIDATLDSDTLTIKTDWISSDLCSALNGDDYFGDYAYDEMASGIFDCIDADGIVPTLPRTWNTGTRSFDALPKGKDKPKSLATSLAIEYILPVLAIAILCFVIFWKYFNPRFKNLEPLTELELVQLLFKAHNDGLFMSSYQWNDRVDPKDPQGKIPRKLAGLLPHAWLDLENLIPGTQIAPTCNAAAKNALFRFAFVSADYFKSKNCGVEWVEIKDQPERTFIFAYPSTPEDKLKELEEKGHKIFKMPEVHNDVGPSWLNQHLIQSRAANIVFAQKTPPINENWLPTLRYYFAKPDWQWLTVPFPMLFFWLAFIIFHVAFISAYHIWSVFDEPESTIGYLCFILPLVGIICCLYLMWVLKGTGFEAPNLVYACQLLYLLKHLGVIDTQTLYTNCPNDVQGLDELVKLGIIKMTDNLQEADIRLLNIDSLSDLPPPRPQDSIWASKGFMELDQSVRDRIGSFLIGAKKDICEIEFMACKILIGAFRCPSTDSLSVGSLGWQKLNLKSSVGV
jgi:hypothetical protein